MGAKSKIEWTEATWNPIRGCTRVSEGCRNCYAEAVAARFSRPGRPYHGLAVWTQHGEPHWTGKVELVESALDLPLRWRQPRRIFVNSMSDLFHESVPDEWIDRIFGVMAAADKHIFQVLTKRPERMRAWFAAGRIQEVTNWKATSGLYRAQASVCYPDWPLPHVWLGVSVEDQPTADQRIPLLLQTPAAVRFVSYEPALGPVDFTRIDYTWQLNDTLKKAAAHSNTPVTPDDLGKPGTAWLDVLDGTFFDGWDLGVSGPIGEKPWRLDWLVVGGESGPRARPFDVAWARTTIAQCRAAGVPCFVKQLGARWAKARNVGRNGQKKYNRKGGNPAVWPADLRVREYPNLDGGNGPRS